MKNTIFLLLLFLLLGGGSWWYLKHKDEKSSINTEDRKFAVVQTDQIYKIFIADRTGEKNTLTRKGDHWMYNGKNKARPNAMDNLLDAISRQELKYIPAKAAVPNIIRDLATNGIKVELYDKENKLLKSYYVGGMTNDETGTYFIMEGAEQPYVMHIPGWEGGLRARYQLRGEAWRDKAIFKEPVEEIQSVSVEYPLQKSKSFTLQRAGKKWEVKPFYDITPVSKKEVKQGLVEAFLVNFAELQAEAFENGSYARDSIIAQVPFAVIILEDTAGKTTTAAFHPIAPTRADGSLIKDSEVLGAKTAVERYFVNVNDNQDFMLAQHRVFKVIFWPYEAFFE